MGRIGPIELILILAVALLIFGPAKLPEMGKAIGKGLKEFKNATKEFQSSTDSDAKSSEGESNKKDDN